MNALEIAECFELYACDHKPDGWPAIRQGTLDEAAAMLRRQHEAIVKLREALAEMKAHATQIESKVGYLSAKRKQEVGQIYNLAAQALQDTEDLK